MALSELADMQSRRRFAVFCWHRRAGKDDVMLHHNACATQERVGNYWYMLPEYTQCRKAIWEAINPHTGKRRIEEAFPSEIIEGDPLNQEMKLRLKNGSTWQVMGSDRHDSLVGSPPIGITFSEYAVSNPSSWAYLSPIIDENGGWAIFNSTPRGKNHFYNLFNYAKGDDEWYSELLTVDDTNVFTEERLLKRLNQLQSEHGDDYGKALWLQEYYCSFDAAIPGAIWGDSLTKLTNDGRLTIVDPDPQYPVFTGWDIGRSDMTAIWFYQVVDGSVKFIDFYKDNLKEIEDYCHMLRDKGQKRGFRYGSHWLPHDAKALRMGMGGKTIAQQFNDYKAKIKIKDEFDIGQFEGCPKFGKEDTIQAARRTFQISVFDERYCLIGFDHLKSYHREYDNEKKVFSTNAVHDEHSHPADAMRTVAMTWTHARDHQIILSTEAQLLAGSVQNVRFGDLRKQHFRKKRLERANRY